MRRSQYLNQLEKREVESLGEEIRLIRFKRRIGTRQAAKEAKVSPSCINRIENGLSPTLGAYLAIVQWVWNVEEQAAANAKRKAKR